MHVQISIDIVSASEEDQCINKTYTINPIVQSQHMN